MTCAPAASVMPIIRPSTWAGTPLSSWLGHPAHPLRPVLAHQVVVAADAAAGDDHRLTRETRTRRRRFATTPRPRGALDGSSTAPRTPVTAPSSTISSSTRCRCAKRHLRRCRAAGARRSSTMRGPGAPGDVEPRHRVAVSACVVAAALGPADQREDLQPALPQPAALLPRGEVDVGVRPLPGPVVLGPVERRRCPASPAAPVRGCRGCPAGAVRGCRRRTGRRTTRTPARRGWRRSPGRRSAPAGRVRPVHRRRPDPASPLRPR